MEDLNNMRKNTLPNMNVFVENTNNFEEKEVAKSIQFAKSVWFHCLVNCILNPIKNSN